MGLPAKVFIYFKHPTNATKKEWNMCWSKNKFIQAEKQDSPKGNRSLLFMLYKSESYLTMAEYRWIGQNVTENLIWMIALTKWTYYDAKLTNSNG
jgi:hypothetical protein